MIAIDTNIIVHLLVRSQKEHGRVRKWFETVEGRLATTATNLAEALRLLTHPRVFPSPLSLVEAIDLVREFIEKCDMIILEEADDWWLDLMELARQIPTLRGNEVFDARIALCLRYHGIKEICTLDSDFSKYPFLKIISL